MDDVVWDYAVFSMNRDRLLDHEVVEAFFNEGKRTATASFA
jgi:hypothetical protein